MSATITRAEMVALRAVGDGADVFSPLLARTLRELTRLRPSPVTIVPAMGSDEAGVRPYFGAILTAAGKELVSPSRAAAPTSVEVIVHHRGDTNLARAGCGKASRSASSTNAGIYAAENAARKFFGQDTTITLHLVQNGDGCGRVPSIYRAVKEGAS